MPNTYVGTFKERGIGFRSLTTPEEGMDDCNWCDRSQIAETDHQYHPGRFGFPLKDPSLFLRPTQNFENITATFFNLQQ